VSTSVKAYAPASVANIICGFDVLGLALETPGDLVSCTRSAQPGIRIAPLKGPYKDLPTHPDQNTAGVAVQALLKHSGSRQGLALEM
jgi:homoserine kinase